MRLALAAGDAEQTREGTERRTGSGADECPATVLSVTSAPTAISWMQAPSAAWIAYEACGVDLEALREERNRAEGRAVPRARIPSTSASPHGVSRLARDRARFHRFNAEYRHPPRPSFSNERGDPQLETGRCRPAGLPTRGMTRRTRDEEGNGRTDEEGDGQEPRARRVAAVGSWRGGATEAVGSARPQYCWAQAGSCTAIASTVRSPARPAPS